jgi:hypothetical protein
MISTFHEDEMVNVQVRQRGHQERVTVPKPRCIVDYNTFMNGVDRIDQQIQYYPFVRKTTKWHKKFTMYLFELALHNAFILFRIQNPNSKCTTLFHFITAVCRSWTSPRRADSSSPRPPMPSPVPSPRSGAAAARPLHKLMLFKPTTKKAYPTRQCVVCKRAGIRAEVRTFCVACGVALHGSDKGKTCFAVHHST